MRRRRKRSFRGRVFQLPRRHKTKLTVTPTLPLGGEETHLCPAGVGVGVGQEGSAPAPPAAHVDPAAVLRARPRQHGARGRRLRRARPALSQHPAGEQESVCVCVCVRVCVCVFWNVVPARE